MEHPLDQSIDQYLGTKRRSSLACGLQRDSESYLEVNREVYVSPSNPTTRYGWSMAINYLWERPVFRKRLLYEMGANLDRSAGFTRTAKTRPAKLYSSR